MASTATSPPSVKTRILIISDTHTADLQHSGSKHAFRHPLPKADVLLHCGDLTMVGKLKELDKVLQMLGKIDAELKLVIAGNHDISLDEQFYERRGWSMQDKDYKRDVPQQAMLKMKGKMAEDAGVTYLEEGLHSFTLKSGAKFSVYASPYQPEFRDWAFAYRLNEDRWNPAEVATPGARSIAEHPIPDFPNVDIIMTHGPPLAILDQTSRGWHVGCPHLRRAARRAKPRLHCFGHIHEAWGACIMPWNKPEPSGGKHADLASMVEMVPTKERGRDDRDEVAYIDVSSEGREALKYGEETLMVNASIMNLRYYPTKAPWVVDIDLPRDVDAMVYE